MALPNVFKVCKEGETVYYFNSNYMAGQALTSLVNEMFLKDIETSFSYLSTQSLPQKNYSLLFRVLRKQFEFRKYNQCAL